MSLYSTQPEVVVVIVMAAVEETPRLWVQESFISQTEEFHRIHERKLHPLSLKISFLTQRHTRARTHTHTYIHPPPTTHPRPPPTHTNARTHTGMWAIPVINQTFTRASSYGLIWQRVRGATWGLKVELASATWRLVRRSRPLWDVE